MNEPKHIASVDDAAELLRRLGHEETLKALHFEFDVGVNEPPTVRYEIDRYIGIGVGCVWL